MNRLSETDLQICSQCGKCRAVCPAGIDIPKVLRLYKADCAIYSGHSAAEDCIECGACSAHCEMGLPVKDIVREMAMLQVTAVK